MKCPVCGCLEFYVKDPEDEFETYELSVADGGVRLAAGGEGPAPVAVVDATETFCNRCSWHGQLKELKKTS
jgi:hypothetical protein